jgi:hypothetical protein
MSFKLHHFERFQFNTQKTQPRRYPHRNDSRISVPYRPKVNTERDIARDLCARKRNNLFHKHTHKHTFLKSLELMSFKLHHFERFQFNTQKTQPRRYPHRNDSRIRVQYRPKVKY